MTWQFAIILQILASSVMTLFSRHIALSVKKVFFGVALLSYLTVAVAGWVYASLAHGGLHVSSDIWPYLVVEGVFIPAAWLIQYRLIAYIGASNTVIVATLNTLVTALAGVLFLDDPLSLAFMVGGALVFGGVAIALRLQPDTKHHVKASLTKKVTLTVAGSLLFAVGMYAEKVAVNDMGAWSYMGIGWSMQALGALALFVFFGRKELRFINKPAVSKGVLLGVLTSIAGMLYIYAVSIGTLSHTIVASSGKAAVVMILAALFLRERNALPQRVAAFLLTMVGLFLILS